MRRLLETLASYQAFFLLFISKKNVVLTSAILLPLLLLSNNNKTILIKDKLHNEYSILMDCDNVTDGGAIEGDEEGCPSPVFDPTPITNVTLPSGGSGDLEYLWIFTHDDPTLPSAQWEPIPGSNSMDYDPGPITQTTWYMRCARRTECVEYIGESNFVVKEVDCCDNITDGGMICCDQQGCGPEFDPAILLNLITPTGGTGDIEYLWFSSTVGPPFIQGSPDWDEITGSNVASYDPGPITETTWFIRCSRRSECEMYTGETNIIQVIVYPNPVLTSEIIGNIQCAGDTSVNIDLSISNGTEPYEIFWDSGLGNIEDPENLGAGTYAVTIIDANGCTADLGVSITEPAALQITLGGTNVACVGENTGFAEVEIIGGTPEYSILWNDPSSQTDTIANNLSAGTYTVTVTDGNGCEQSDSLTINEVAPLTISLTGQDESCEGQMDGLATVEQISGGTPGYSIIWSDPMGQTSQTIENLSAGNYSVTVSDSNGCEVSDTLTVNAGMNLEIQLSSTSASCSGIADGSVMVTEVLGGSGNYQYQWNDTGMQSTQTVENLSAGTYTVIVTDESGCFVIDSIIVDDGVSLEVNLDGSNETCIGAADGQVSVATVNGGIAPFNYLWSNNGTNSSIENLSPGVYELTITDSGGCSSVSSYEVLGGSNLVLTLNATNVNCGGNTDGVASVTVDGGVGDYTYFWSDTDNQTTNTATNLPVGSYTVTVTDGNGCTASGSVSVEAPNSLEFTVVGNDATCNGYDDGSAQVEFTTDDPSMFSYSWNDPNNSTTALVNNLPTGSYEVTITSINGCVEIGSVTIGEPEILALTVLTGDASCFSSSDGSAGVTVSGGQGPYTYAWDDPSASTNNSITNVPAGLYHVTVTDALGCQIIGGAQINEPNSITINSDIENVDCPGESNGSISINAVGGSAPYTYEWDNNSTSQTIQNLGVGIYVVTVSDANGCTNSTNLTVELNSDLSIEVVSNDLTCPNASDGLAQVIVSGGVPNISIQWDDSNNSTSSSVPNLDAGFYNVTVEDGLGCTATGQAQIFEPIGIQLSLTKTDVICQSDSDGTATVEVIGGSGSYSYLWNDPSQQASSTATNLSVGSYEVIVTNADGCAETGSISIDFTSNLDIILTSEDVDCFGAFTGEVTANAFGGNGPYQYEWNIGNTESSISGLLAGNYEVTATDQDGCTVSSDIAISQPTAINCSVTQTSNISNFGASNGAAAATADGGTGNLSYNWSNGATTPEIENLNSGNYTLTVTDENNCTCVTSILIQNPAKVGDFVWKDLNENGVQDFGEPGLADVDVFLTGNSNSGEVVNKSTVSDEDGYYQFDDLEAGTYQLSFGLLATYNYSTANIGLDSKDSDVDPVTGSTASFAINTAECNLDLDAGFYQYDDVINIGDLVWFDSNRDGIQDQGETGVQGVAVRLISLPSNSVIQTTSTNFLGLYEFQDVSPGEYQIEFVPSSIPTGYTYSPQDAIANDLLDSDVDTLTGKTDPFIIFPFSPDDYSFDAGMYPKCENVTDGGLIGGEETLCGIGADPAIIEDVELPSGGFGTLEYVWLQSFIPIYSGAGDPNWTMVPNSNSASLDPLPITQTTYYIRCARRECCEDYIGESNIVAKNVMEVPLTNIEPGPNIACVDEEIDFEATNAGGGASYFWDFGQDATPQTADFRVVPDVSWSTPGIKTISLTVTRFGCSLTVTDNITIISCGGANLIGFDNFEIDAQEESVELNWRMNDDMTDGLFYIQRSSDGDSFETIQMIAADTDIDTYSFIDENPRPGENHYKIEFENFEGTSVNSETLMTVLEKEGIAAIRFYPNPFFGSGTVELLEKKETEVQILISNGFGHVVYSGIIDADEKELEINLEDLPNGMYYIMMKEEGKREIIQRIFKGE